MHPNTFKTRSSSEPETGVLPICIHTRIKSQCVYRHYLSRVSGRKGNQIPLVCGTRVRDANHVIKMPSCLSRATGMLIVDLSRWLEGRIETINTPYDKCCSYMVQTNPHKKYIIQLIIMKIYMKICWKSTWCTVIDYWIIYWWENI